MAEESKERILGIITAEDQRKHVRDLGLYRVGYHGECEFGPNPIPGERYVRDKRSEE